MNIAKTKATAPAVTTTTAAEQKDSAAKTATTDSANSQIQIQLHPVPNPMQKQTHRHQNHNSNTSIIVPPANSHSIDLPTPAKKRRRISLALKHPSASSSSTNPPAIQTPIKPLQTPEKYPQTSSPYHQSTRNSPSTIYAGALAENWQDSSLLEGLFPVRDANPYKAILTDSIQKHPDQDDLVDLKMLLSYLNCDTVVAFPPLLKCLPAANSNIPVAQQQSDLLDVSGVFSQSLGDFFASVFASCPSTPFPKLNSDTEREWCDMGGASLFYLERDFSEVFRKFDHSIIVAQIAQETRNSSELSQVAHFLRDTEIVPATPLEINEIDRKTNALDNNFQEIFNQREHIRNQKQISQQSLIRSRTFDTNSHTTPEKSMKTHKLGSDLKSSEIGAAGSSQPSEADSFAMPDSPSIRMPSKSLGQIRNSQKSGGLFIEMLIQSKDSLQIDRSPSRRSTDLGRNPVPAVQHKPWLTKNSGNNAPLGISTGPKNSQHSFSLASSNQLLNPLEQSNLYTGSYAPVKIEQPRPSPLSFTSHKNNAIQGIPTSRQFISNNHKASNTALNPFISSAAVNKSQLSLAFQKQSTVAVTAGAKTISPDIPVSAIASDNNQYADNSTSASLIARKPWLKNNATSGNGDGDGQQATGSVVDSLGSVSGIATALDSTVQPAAVGIKPWQKQQNGNYSSAYRSDGGNSHLERVPWISDVVGVSAGGGNNNDGDGLKVKPWQRKLVYDNSRFVVGEGGGDGTRIITPSGYGIGTGSGSGVKAKPWVKLRSAIGTVATESSIVKSAIVCPLCGKQMPAGSLPGETGKMNRISTGIRSLSYFRSSPVPAGTVHRQAAAAIYDRVNTETRVTVGSLGGVGSAKASSVSPTVAGSSSAQERKSVGTNKPQNIGTKFVYDKEHVFL
ncbi:hypothetical protein HK100_001500 [Physocladia obscura]|uniref:Uncharacterized protein n=1 Tax=Physocladia obscura TaxID=109957 RepID=A0AAD5XG45_9FUNG|nr:hypothetical protein HK100_001500 [Physocladia obscura]